MKKDGKLNPDIETNTELHYTSHGLWITSA